MGSNELAYNLSFFISKQRQGKGSCFGIEDSCSFRGRTRAFSAGADSNNVMLKEVSHWLPTSWIS